ncbi:MAG: hypothetical protein M1831_006333 [Alyxoria varia]|nr:MAG: hypothetical protein M1831_006333 [Alyxoria varia]
MGNQDAIEDKGHEFLRYAPATSSAEEADLLLPKSNEEVGIKEPKKDAKEEEDDDEDEKGESKELANTNDDQNAHYTWSNGLIGYLGHKVEAVREKMVDACSPTYREAKAPDYTILVQDLSYYSYKSLGSPARCGKKSEQQIDIADYKSEHMTYYRMLHQCFELKYHDAFLCFPCNAFRPGSAWRHPTYPATKVKLWMSPTEHPEFHFGWTFQVMKLFRRKRGRLGCSDRPELFGAEGDCVMRWDAVKPLNGGPNLG